MQGPGAPLHLWPGIPSGCRLHLDVGTTTSIWKPGNRNYSSVFGGKKGYLIRVTLT